jgi:hypothetical protein
MRGGPLAPARGGSSVSHGARVLLALLALAPAVPAANVAVPGESDWVDHGIVLRPGGVGDCSESSPPWDCRLGGGMSPASMLRFGNQYFLYYVGSRGNRGDGGPAFRSLGVATCSVSANCKQEANWTKHAGNPILEYFPNDNDEEGIFSATTWVEGGTIHLFYGTDEWKSGNEVTADIWHATSSDGFSFTGKQKILDAENCSLPGCGGSGNEIWPLAVIRHAGVWYLYYSGDDWKLYVAWGNAPTSLGQGKLLYSSQRNFSHSVVDLGDDFASFRWQDMYPVNGHVSCPARESAVTWRVHVADVLASDPTTLEGDRTGSEFPYGWGEFSLGHVAWIDGQWWLWHMDDCPADYDWDHREGEFIRLRTFATSTTPEVPAPPTDLSFH